MEDEQLLNRLRQTYTDLDTENFDVLDFVAAFGSPLQALMYSGLSWPELVEIGGMVFLKESLEYEDDRRRLAEALAHYGGDLTQTEQAFNLVEVPSGLFTGYEARKQTQRRRICGLRNASHRCGMPQPQIPGTRVRSGSTRGRHRRRRPSKRNLLPTSSIAP